LHFGNKHTVIAEKVYGNVSEVYLLLTIIPTILTVQKFHFTLMVMPNSYRKMGAQRRSAGDAAVEYLMQVLEVKVEKKRQKSNPMEGSKTKRSRSCI